MAEEWTRTRASTPYPASTRNPLSLLLANHVMNKYTRRIDACTRGVVRPKR